MTQQIGQGGFGFLDEIQPDKINLRARFLVPPFTLLDTRAGYWRERKAEWLGLGIKSEIGRGLLNPQKGRPETTSPIDFYARKRAIEAELGHEITKDEAAQRIAATGKLRDERISSLTMRSTPPDGPNVTQGADGKLVYKPPRGAPPARAIGTQDWVKDKIAKGDINGGMAGGLTGTSIFDPVLCELVYRWFCPANGNVLDPFAGGSVRGIVAGMMKLSYTGFDLSARQIEANEEQKVAILGEAPPVWWINADARDIKDKTAGLLFDFVLTCPPYYDLEVYTDDPADLSHAKTYEDFISAYFEIIAGCVDRLKNNRFACFVVGNIRDKRGFYHNLVGDTVMGFEACGVHLYNDAVLMNVVGSLPVRITKQFNSGRKMGKCHQNVLVFYKGDPSRIKHEFGGDVVMEWKND